VARLIEDDEARMTLAMRAYSLIDGLGATRVADAILRMAPR
jgi:hypothetical protein